jgi:hypothetical protein
MTFINTRKKGASSRAPQETKPVPLGEPVVPKEDNGFPEVDWTGETKVAVTAGNLTPSSKQGKLPAQTPSRDTIPPIASADSTYGGVINRGLTIGPRLVAQGQMPPPVDSLPHDMERRQDEVRHDAGGKSQALQGAMRAGIPGATALARPIDAKTLGDIHKIGEQMGMDLSASTSSTSPLDNPDVSPVFLDLLLIKSWGNWFAWDPMTVWAELQMTFGVRPTRRMKDLVLALQTIHVSTKPFTDWETFVRVAGALNGHDTYFDDLPELSPAQVAFAVAVMRKLRTMEFSEQVIRYWSGLCLYDQLLVAPHELRQAQAYMDTSLGRSHPELLQVKAQVVDALNKNWAPTGEDTIQDEQLRRLRAIDAFVQLKMAMR